MIDMIVSAIYIILMFASFGLIGFAPLIMWVMTDHFGVFDYPTKDDNNTTEN